MVGFRNIAGVGSLVHWWDNGFHQIAIGRENTGVTTAFMVINNDNHELNMPDLLTGLPPGIYCDVISGNLENGRCSGKSATVGNDRGAAFHISQGDGGPMIAIHINAKVA